MARALGRYELLRPLARGGMADVYLARRRAAGVEKWLVVKRMRPERTGDPRFLDLFVREARLSMSLAHQNIVPVFDFGRIDDQVFLAMERVEGKDLGSSLARAPNHRLPPLLAAFIAAECCQALDYAHQRKGPDGVALGIVHRDVTPRNVLLSWSGEVKLTDFGIAALAGDATSRLLGTPQYMAPEQARSEPIDPRADLYAIGLVLREAVTGIRPRPGTDRDSILDAARRGELLPWSHAAEPDAGLALGSGDHGEPPAAEVPPAAAEEPSAALIAIIDRATAVAAADRYADARTMLEDLDAFIVVQRAAHKAESPARQLAAWLAAVWEGERDDADADAAIQADHLVSFLDDGAFDVIGTGTVRSLAATAADELPDEVLDDASADLASPPPPSPIAKATVVATPGGTPATAPAGGAGADHPARLSRISSSMSTVASGSFHTLPTPSGTGRVPRKSRRSAPLAGIALIAIASGAVVFWVMSGSRGRGPERPGQLAAGQPSAGQLAAGQANPGQLRSGQPNPGQSNSSQSNPGQRSSGQPGTGQPGSGQPTLGQPASGQPASGQPASRQPGSGQPASGQPASRQPGSGQPGTGQPGSGQPGSGQPSAGRPASGQSATSSTGPGTTSAGHGASPPPHAAPGSGSQAPHTGRPASEPPGQDPGPGSGSAGGSGSASGVGSDRPRPATCKVRFNMTPWAYYTIDEDTTRHETPGTVELTPGPHRLHVWNPELHVERYITIDVPADRDVMSYSEPLQPSSLPPATR